MCCSFIVALILTFQSGKVEHVAFDESGWFDYSDDALPSLDSIESTHDQNFILAYYRMIGEQLPRGLGKGADRQHQHEEGHVGVGELVRVDAVRKRDLRCWLHSLG